MNELVEAQRKMNVVVEGFNEACRDNKNIMVAMRKMLEIWHENKHLLEPFQ